MTQKQTDKERLFELLREKNTRKDFQQLQYFEPYSWQNTFMDAGNGHAQRLLMCANRIGKTFTGARELAYHLTGLYPHWWKGRRFDRPVKAWACGKTNETTRDVVQAELIGPPEDISLQGTGAIPLSCLGERTRKPQLPNALSSILIRHVPSGGWSQLGFKSYEMGQEKFMGYGRDVIWLDEEPDMAIFTQCITRTATTGGILYMTFTPEAGKTEVVTMFMDDLKPGQFMIQAGWDDAPHLSEEVKNQLLAVYPQHEREMRSKGIPVFGSGLVFPVHLMDDITIDPVQLPSHFPRLAGIDFGWEHPTAAIWIAVDRESDKVFVYDEYKDRQQTPQVHALNIHSRGPGVPISWPKDGLITEKSSGHQLAEIYRKCGLNMLPSHFTNAPTVDKPQGTVSVEAGIMEIYQMMEQHRLLIFSTLTELPREIRQYHRVEGKLVQKDEDLIQAMRYAVCNRRFASTVASRQEWGQTIDYSQLAKGIL